MTDVEFRIIDELYFVTAYADLLAATGIADSELAPPLKSLLDAGLIKAFFPDPDTEIAAEDTKENQLRKCFFLATKAGLLAHNSR